jgi:hypothetical protein
VIAVPADYQLGHQPGDHRGLVAHHIVARADSAGASHGFVAGLPRRTSSTRSVTRSTPR